MKDVPDTPTVAVPDTYGSTEMRRPRQLFRTQQNRYFPDLIPAIVGPQGIQRILIDLLLGNTAPRAPAGRLMVPSSAMTTPTPVSLTVTCQMWRWTSSRVVAPSRIDTRGPG